MKKNQTKQTKQSKPGKGATVRRYIVEWKAEGNSHCKTFPNLPRAQGYAKEWGHEGYPKPTAEVAV